MISFEVMSFEVWVVGMPLSVICFHVMFFQVWLVGMPLLVICFHVIFFQVWLVGIPLSVICFQLDFYLCILHAGILLYIYGKSHTITFVSNLTST
jgi:phenolic acid decarboxylase